MNKPETRWLGILGNVVCTSQIVPFKADQRQSRGWVDLSDKHHRITLLINLDLFKVLLQEEGNMSNLTNSVQFSLVPKHLVAIATTCQVCQRRDPCSKCKIAMHQSQHSH